MLEFVRPAMWPNTPESSTPLVLCLSSPRVYLSALSACEFKLKGNFGAISLLSKNLWTFRRDDSDAVCPTLSLTCHVIET